MPPLLGMAVGCVVVLESSASVWVPVHSHVHVLFGDVIRFVCSAIHTVVAAHNHGRNQLNWFVGGDKRSDGQVVHVWPDNLWLVCRGLLVKDGTVGGGGGGGASFEPVGIGRCLNGQVVVLWLG